MPAPHAFYSKMLAGTNRLAERLSFILFYFILKPSSFNTSVPCMPAQALISSTTAPPRLQHRTAGGKVNGPSPLETL